MRVLIIATDLFRTTGGGQSFYASLIRQCPGYEFTYFTTDAALESAPFPNVRTVPLLDTYRRLGPEAGLDRGDFEFEGFELAPAGDAVRYIIDFAASVSGQTFDVVDIPDFLAFGAFVPPALRAMGVRFGKAIVSMHGTISDALTDNWSGSPPDLTLLSYFEELLYRTADGRYAISKPYLEDWQRRTGVPGHLLDLLSLIDLETFADLRATASGKLVEARPDIAFVGRQEKWKGPDLFIDIASGLPRRSFGAALLVGPGVQVGGVESRSMLEEMAARRRLEIKQTAQTQVELWRSYAEGLWATIIPSRKDTFNLAALESVLCGCPTLISNRAGVCDFLKDTFPGIPVQTFDIADLGGCREQLLKTLATFSERRSELRKYLETAQPQQRGKSIDSVYSAASARDERKADALAEVFSKIVTHIESAAATAGRADLREHVQRQSQSIFANLTPGLRSWGPTIFDQALTRMDAERALLGPDGQVPLLQDYEYARLSNQLAPACFYGDRAGLYDLLAELELKRGNDILYATYTLRSARLTGARDQGRLTKALKVLRDSKFEEEADAADMLYGASASVGRARDYLDNMAKRFHTPLPENFTKVIDRRTSGAPKISIIVSLYNAADKLPTFLRGLGRLTETSKRRMEVVLVDSNSPDNTPAVAEDELAQRKGSAGFDISTLYVRTKDRETIQRAWNRGIALARGDYLAFLGVDEMNRADTFDLLGDYLDKNSQVDWVQGTAVVTEVDKHGAFVADVMAYDRNFDNANVQLLDTCFIGYVGALYRKSVHSRVGFYDDRFRAAGDTEFKNRAWPQMRVATIPECLGFFWNYPDERTTHSPTAEIEDIRAWHLHRSVAGMGYAFDGGRTDDAVDLFFKCLGHRKSYMTRICTDLDLAAVLAEYLRDQSGEAYRRVVPYAPLVRGLRDCFRTIDDLTRVTRQIVGVRRASETSGVLESALYSVERSLNALSVLPHPVAVDLQSDNRFHQHFLIWPSKLAKAAVPEPEVENFRAMATVEENIAAADMARDSRRWREAAFHYKAALDENSNLAGIWVQYGHALKESGNRGAAETAYRNALKLEADNADTHLQLGHLMKLLDRPQEARASYLNALLADADQVDARRELMAFGMTRNQIAAAIRTERLSA